MEVYIFRAALICEPCALAHKRDFKAPPYVDESNESTYDSDVWPKGPYSDGGGEADTAQHCDHCATFLQNPLTPDGVAHVREMIRARRAALLHDWAGRRRGQPQDWADVWQAFYADDLLSR